MRSNAHKRRLRWTNDGLRAYYVSPQARDEQPILFARISHDCTDRSWAIYTNDFRKTGIVVDSYSEAVRVIEGLWALEH